MAGVVAAIAPAVVQVRGHRAPVSGVVYANDVVLTNARALGRDDGLQVRPHDGRALTADLHGWDPATGLALLRVKELAIAPATQAPEAAQVGNLAIAVARSWSNSLTASVGIVSVIGGPLRTGRRRQIEEVIRTTAPMHDGFAGGAFVDMSSQLIGIATAAAIRGLGVIIPAAIAWKTAGALLEHGRIRRGYLGIAGQQVELSERQRAGDRAEHALLIANVKNDSPAARAGLLVGDIMITFDGQPVESPEELLDLLSGDRVGSTVVTGVLRGDSVHEVRVTIADRADRQ